MSNRIALVLITAFLICSLAPALAAGQHGCTTANVAGTYGYVGFGTLLAGNFLGLPAGTFSQVGTLTFDGKGNLLIVDTGRVDDVIFPPDLEYPSTYSVNEQCVVTFTLKAWTDAGIPGPHFKAVFVDNRNGLRTMSITPGIIVSYVNTTKIKTDDED